jgi:hypothetical protein
MKDIEHLRFDLCCTQYHNTRTRKDRAIHHPESSHIAAIQKDIAIHRAESDAWCGIVRDIRVFVMMVRLTQTACLLGLFSRGMSIDDI